MAQQNMCGISVVRDFEKLKRYNLNEVLKAAKGETGEGALGKDEKSQEIANQSGAGEDV